jgi:uncharacterized protein YjcR
MTDAPRWNPKGIPAFSTLEAWLEDGLAEWLGMVGVAEIAERAGVKADTVLKWRQRHADFPAPTAELKMGPVWFWPTVEPWVTAQKAKKPGAQPS